MTGLKVLFVSLAGLYLLSITKNSRLIHLLQRTLSIRFEPRKQAQKKIHPLATGVHVRRHRNPIDRKRVCRIGKIKA